VTTTIKPRPAARKPPPPPSLPRAALNWLRRGWRRLTSMRTALVLLFLLAVAAVPGSLLPQRPLNPSKVDSYLASHGAWGRLLDRFGFFDVFGSAWFAAIYLLLAISLVGCLIPRIRVHARGAVAKPLPAPKNLSKLPESSTFTVDGTVAEVSDDLQRRLGRRWRRIVRADGSTGQAISAEKGYLRETGNLLFHVALLVSLVAIAAGRLWGYSASIVVVEGSGFCNTVQQYDSWRPGRFEQAGNVAPFCVNLDKFQATYLSTGEPSKFNADVTYQRGGDGPDEKSTIQVNHPLRLEGDRVYIIGHGYAPKITVTRPGLAPITDVVPFIPQDPNTFQSEGAFQELGPVGSDGKKTKDIGISGFFSPTPVESSSNVFTSAAPQVANPVLGVFVYQGDLGFDGLPKSVYSLDQGQIDNGELKQIGTANLRIGQSVTTANGVKVTFDGWTNWVSFQISHDPTQGYLLISASAMVVGLIGSLAVRRRRVWIRLRPADEVAGADGDPKAKALRTSRTVVDIGGLARSDSGNFTDEFAALVNRLRAGDRDDDSSGTKGTA
jgi:cytochrome c biogenesis protein